MVGFEILHQPRVTTDLDDDVQNLTPNTADVDSDQVIITLPKGNNASKEEPVIDPQILHQPSSPQQLQPLRRSQRERIHQIVWFMYNAGTSGTSGTCKDL